MKWDLRRTSMTAVAALFAACIVAAGAAQTATAASTTTVYVAPNGSGSTCSSSAPCSIGAAQTLVRNLESSSPSGNVTVQLAGGTYRLSSPLSFGAADGGHNGTTVTWAAAPGATPVITGAQQITGWSVYDSAAGIYSANTPTGLDSRDLFVNNQLAPRASITLGTSDISITSTGFTVNNSALSYLSSLPEQSRIEFESTASFTDRYAPVSSISGTTVTMAQPAWNDNLWGYDTIESPFATPIYHLENSLKFLTSAGQWYLDPQAGKLYYKPATGVNPSSLDVELPTLQTLISVGGSYSSPVMNLTFQGLQFSGTTWLNPGTAGYADQQTGGYIQGTYSYYPSSVMTTCNTGCPAFERARTTWSQAPAAVQVSAASGISFVGNTFQALGEVGLGIGNDDNAHVTGVGLGASNIAVTGNIFTNLGGGGIAAGGIQANAHHPSAANMTDQNITISNNTISDVSKDYGDQPGILSTYVTAATITHNEVKNVPYDGIDLGYGWGVNDPGGSQDYVNRGYYQYNPTYSTPTTLKNNVVSGNLIHHTKLLFHDGGSLYNLSASPGSVFSSNYMYDMLYTTGLYLDEGSRYLTLKNNVVQDAGTWLFANCNSNNNTKDNTADGNWHNSGGLAGEWDSTTNNTVTNDHPVSGTAWPPAALTVMCNAGVQFPYRNALNSAPCGNPAVSSSFSTTSSTSSAFSQNGSQFAISAAGADIWGAGGQHDDAYGAIYRAGSVTSGTSVTARVDQQNDANAWAKTGVVIRNNLSQAESAAGYAVVAVTPGSGVSFQWDSNGDGYLDSLSTVSQSANVPIWVRLVRNGAQVSGYYSTDGVTFTQIGTAQTLTGATTTQDGGIIASSHNASTAATNLVSNLQIVNGVASGSSFFATGNAVAAQSGTSYSLGGEGADVWGAGGQHDDAYATIYKAASLGATNSVSAKVVTQADTNSWAKSGVAIRANLAQPGSAGGYAVVVVTPANGVGFEWDSNGDGYIDSSTVVSIATNQAIWVRLTRNGNQVSAFYSLDGSTYTQIGTAQTLAGMTTQEDAGIISTSHDASSLAANTFSTLAIG